VPAKGAGKPEQQEAIEAMRAFVKVKGVKGTDINAWIAEGRM
jgi:hypothetical protein